MGIYIIIGTTRSLRASEAASAQKDIEKQELTRDKEALTSNYRILIVQ